MSSSVSQALCIRVCVTWQFLTGSDLSILSESRSNSQDTNIGAPASTTYDRLLILTPRVCCTSLRAFPAPWETSEIVSYGRTILLAVPDFPERSSRRSRHFSLRPVDRTLATDLYSDSGSFSRTCRTPRMHAMRIVSKTLKKPLR